MKTAYIFRGAPASGKGTLTKMLLSQMSGKIALLELDTFRWEFHAHTRDIGSVSNDEHRFAYENFLLMLERYAKNGEYTIVIEGLFSWDTPSPHGTMTDILAVLKRYGFKVFSILLSADMDSLQERNAQRTYVVPEKEFSELYENVMQKIGPNEIVIDVAGKTPQAAIEEILQAIE